MKIKFNKYIFSVVLMTLVSYIIYIFLFDNEFIEQTSMIIWILSVIGVFEFLFSVFTWKKITGSVFSPYTIFLMFAYMFTYGQCIMWAFGIHSENEIGKRIMYSSFLGCASETDIINTQLLTLMGLLAFHCGAVFTEKKLFFSCSGSKKFNFKISVDSNEHFIKKTLFQVSLVSAIISFPITIYNSLRLLYVYKVFGYGANLNNLDVSASTNTNLILLSLFFFPSIVGLLLASNFKKNVMYICYIFFGLFSVISLLGGDRGEWLYPLLFLFWLHNRKFQVKINYKRIINYVFLASVSVIILSALKNAREYGVTLELLIDAIVSESNPIASTLFETGKQMAIPLIFLQNGWDIYPYGNTYLFAIFEMVTIRIIRFFEPSYIGIASWLSKEYLGISYGAGFSFIAEALVNFGPYLGIFALLVIGFLYSKVLNLKDSDFGFNSLSLFFKVTTAEALVISIRNPLATALKTWFFSTVLIYVVVKIILMLNNKKTS